MFRLKRYLMMIRIFFRTGYDRAEFLKKRNFFKKIGEHCYLQPWNFGTEPYLISLGNNVHVASNVTFINHDIIDFMFNYMDKENLYKHRTGTIEIGDNVFIGTNTVILYDVKIGNNVVIGAGSIVTKNIPDGVVAVGFPCHVVGKFDEYMQEMKMTEAEF